MRKWLEGMDLWLREPVYNERWLCLLIGAWASVGILRTLTTFLGK